jgi:hypothetical protein
MTSTTSIDTDKERAGSIPGTRGTDGVEKERVQKGEKAREAVTPSGDGPLNWI